MAEDIEARLDEMGAAEIKAALASGQIQENSRWGRAARAWLAVHDHADGERRSQEATDALETAKSAARASWVSAIVAGLALVVSVIALVIAL